MLINKIEVSTHNEQSIKQTLSLESSARNAGPLIISIVGAGGKTHLSDWLSDFFYVQGERVCVTTTTKMYLPESDRFDNLVNLSEQTLAGISLQTPSSNFLYQKRLPNHTATEQTKVKGLSQQTIQTIIDSNLFSVLIIEADGAKHLPIKAPALHEPCIADSSQVVIGVTGAEAIFCKADSQHIHRWSEFSALTDCQSGMKIDQAVLKRLLESPQGLFKGAPEQAVKIWVINKVDRSENSTALQQLANGLLDDLPSLKSIWLTQLNTTNAIKRVLLR